MSDEKQTLIVRHLPSVLTNNEVEDFLKHFGAVNVKFMGSSGRLKHVAFAYFADSMSAEIALHRLHQMDFLQSKLSVEFSKKSYSRNHPSILDDEFKSLSKTEEIICKEKESDELESKKKIRDSITYLSEKWGLDYPLNPKMQYMYPPPDVTILTNIANALASYPKLYVQTLHLMNKMNLPAPFSSQTTTPPLKIQNFSARTGSTLMTDSSSEEESEFESDDESEVRKDKKRAKAHDRESSKLPKLQDIIDKFVLKQPEPAVIPSAIYEKPALKEIHISVPEKMETTQSDMPSVENLDRSSHTLKDSAPLNLPDNFSMNPDDVETPAENEGFGKIKPILKSAVSEVDTIQCVEEWGDDGFISVTKLKSKCLSNSEMRHLNVFRNYDPGDLSSRLYIKNLAKQATEKDLHHIYGQYVDWKNEEEKIVFDIRLMKEGRMKGQAFITLPSEDTAQEARRDTNGFVLHDKPMVVSFARSAKPKPTDN